MGLSKQDTSMTNIWSWTTWDSKIDATTVRKTFALRKTESHMSLLCIPTHRQSHFRQGPYPKAIFGRRWNSIKLTFPRMLTIGHQRYRNHKTVHSQKHQHRDPQVSHCTHHLYIYCHWNLCDFSLCEFGVNVSTQWVISIDHISGLINHVHVIGSLSNCWELESCDWMFSRDPWEWLRDWWGFSLPGMIREWKWTLV